MATYYIDPVSGSNSNDGQSQGLAWLDFTHVNDATLDPGDVVNLLAGTYTDQIVPTRSGTVGTPITLQAISGQACTPIYTNPLTMTAKTANVIIDGGAASVTGVDLSSVDYWYVSGIGVTNCRSGQGVNGFGKTGNTFYNCRIYNNGANGVADTHGIDASTSYGLTIENCEFYQNTHDGIKISNDLGTKNFMVRYNYIHENWDDGITLLARNNAGEWSTIEFNRLDYQFGKSDAASSAFHPDAIEVNMAVRLRIRYNVISDFTQAIYFAGFGGTGGANSREIQDIEIYGNLLWNDRYDSEVAGQMSAIFFDLNGNDSLNDVYVFNNTLGFVGDPGGAVAPFSIYNLGVKTGNNVVLRNNIFADSRDAVGNGTISVDGVTNVDSDWNVFYVSAETENANDIDTDPLFTDYTGRGSTAFDFTLTVSSPSKGTGASDLTSVCPVPATFYDLTGVTRTKDSGDRGALAYTAAASGIAVPIPLSHFRNMQGN